ncbi:hypothetical protein JCM10212_004717 [Sporobolomyces blumeae]
MLLRQPLALAWFGLALLFAPGASCSRSDGEVYRESLVLTPFSDGKLHSEFRFDLSGPWQVDAPHLTPNAIAQHHTLVPRLLTSLVRQYRVTSFRLTLSSGRWHPHWPLDLPAELPASGIELVAWVEDLEHESEQDRVERWEGFVGAVGGLFCAGIRGEGAIKETTSPGWGFEFEGDGDESRHRLQRIVMPRLAAACTESLTPFLSLLPCASHAGLSSLLNPHRLFDGEWTSIDVGVTRLEGEIRVNLGIGSVVDPVRRDRLSGQLGRRQFSFSSVFDRTVKSACPVASSSEVQLVVPTDSVNPFVIGPDETKTLIHIDGRDVVSWETKNAVLSGPLDVTMSWPDENSFRYRKSPSISQNSALPISVRRLLTGHGQERGKIGVEIKNHLEREVDVIWIETWPWWVRSFVSSLRSEGDGAVVDSVVDLDYVPPIARARPTTLQVLLRLPPGSTSRHMLDYESSTLWYTEYPSDANRGFSVPGALVSLLSPEDASSAPLLKLRTPTTLVSLPLPDFSMPYNVIILTSTTIALFFGSVLNGMLRRWYCVDVEEKIKLS